MSLARWSLRHRLNDSLDHLIPWSKAYFGLDWSRLGPCRAAGICFWPRRGVTNGDVAWHVVLSLNFGFGVEVEWDYSPNGWVDSSAWTGHRPVASGDAVAIARRTYHPYLRLKLELHP